MGAQDRGRQRGIRQALRLPAPPGPGGGGGRRAEGDGGGLGGPQLRRPGGGRGRDVRGLPVEVPARDQTRRRQGGEIAAVQSGVQADSAQCNGSPHLPAVALRASTNTPSIGASIHSYSRPTRVVLLRVLVYAYY